MKYSILYILFLGMVLSCSKSDDGYVDNPYLPDYGFDTGNQINITLPEYNNLLVNGGHVELYGFGINGISVYRNGDTFISFELTDPNHNVSTCSKLIVEGIIASCNCSDGNNYDIVTGYPHSGTEGQYTLVPYRVEVSGNIIRVYN